MATIEVKIMREQNGDYFAKVSLSSDRKLGLWSNGKIVLGQHSSQVDFEKAVEALGGSLAERQNENCGDDHDPSEVAKLTLETWREILAEHEQASRGGH